MRKLFFAFGLASSLMFALAQQAAAPNFAGTWTLDKSKSEGLSAPYRTFDRATWVITQTDIEISIKELFVDFKVEAPPSPLRVGRGGGDKPLGPATYKLDGSETTGDRGREKFVRKAILSSDGKTLELVQKIISQGTDGEVTRTSTDKLSLSGDGKVLTVVRHREGVRGPQNSTLIFNK